MPYLDTAELKTRKREEAMRYALDPEASTWTTLVEARAQAALQDAADIIDSFVGQRYTLPLPPVRALKRVNADIAFYLILARRGFQEGTADDVVVRDYEEALKWLRLVAEGKAQIPADDGAPIPPGEAAGGVVSAEAKPEIKAAPRVFGRDKLKNW
ncbi:DUF1320 domain-containing protein [Meiothermus ruber]|uniref:DUF1320 domain-containing protein n=1 Tax=Meiothermus ruber (strain ATCC 35948 / DSM 1279 / VKM B-1258 / 21) TaxID=504728 RepID=D3PTD3_MEIRD|nr:DUF1320 domain-containing protein [Meiothermus ruber]ADD28716.1 protein of unknown function DUF1320 [Meiothermus ruber DSM 1279]AGK05837.1 hypothetical protein K649_12755 [Meiothermus ruber DSM 1279]